MGYTNKVVVDMFLRGIECESTTGNLSCGTSRLFSYSTCIAEFDSDGNLWFNETKYSCTTSHHQGLVKREGCPKIIVDSVPRNTVHIVPKDKRKY